jgi:hypothetical protein
MTPEHVCTVPADDENRESDALLSLEFCLSVVPQALT